MLWINNVLVKSPKVFQPEFNDLDSEDSYRDAKGESHRDRIAIDKRKLNCEWAPLTQEETSTILKAIEPEYFPISTRTKDGLITKTFMLDLKRANATDERRRSNGKDLKLILLRNRRNL